MNTDMQDIEESIVDVVKDGCSKLRGEITRLTRENQELVTQYARLNDEHNQDLDRWEALVQSAKNVYDRMCPDKQELTCSMWTDLWCEIAQPVEMQVRAELVKRDCNIELWIGLEE
jgi:hypothetical protein